ncbi:MAG: PLDc N-terminal domain-containing protein [Candidatus Omnitrophica bacterium]|nr:PLDc N-terminal domain-containing protein [Candidatus Omnitrophota bacterium]
MEFSLVFILYVLVTIIALVDILKGHLSMIKKILWAVILLAVPVLGIILYYLVGRTNEAQAA